MAYRINEYFTYDEFTASSTAKKYFIDNTPDLEDMDNIRKLANDVLLPIRKEYGKPIIVGSGYRCPKLNTKVGGVSNSDHKFGAAADIKSKPDTPEENKKIFDIAVKLAKEGKIKCRQIIDEYGYDWVHISINNRFNKMKNNEILHIK